MNKEICVDMYPDPATLFTEKNISLFSAKSFTSFTVQRMKLIAKIAFSAQFIFCNFAQPNVCVVVFKIVYASVDLQ